MNYFPQVFGANQIGYRIFSRGWIPEFKVLKAGDKIKLAHSNNGVFPVANDVISDADGAALIVLERPLPQPTVNNEGIEIA